MAWTNKYDNFFDADDTDDNDPEEEYDDDDDDEEGENKKPRKKETTARWQPKDARHLQDLALAGKIDFSKEWNTEKNKEVLVREFTGKTDRVLSSHFKKGRALFEVEKSKAGARVREGGKRSCHCFHFKISLAHWLSSASCSSCFLQETTKCPRNQPLRENLPPRRRHPSWQITMTTRWMVSTPTRALPSPGPLPSPSPNPTPMLLQ
jgi:hypothetical protein